MLKHEVFSEVFVLCNLLCITSEDKEKIFLIYKLNKIATQPTQVKIMKWLLKEYMAANHIDNYKELAKQTGIKPRTLRRRIDEPTTKSWLNKQA